MASIVVNGGKPLLGETEVSGAKNAALPILASSLLTEGRIRLLSCPKLRDVDNMLSILSSLGVTSGWSDGALELDPSNASSYTMPTNTSKELRSSIFMLGPLVARFGRAVCTYPGGCEIGPRPIDLHLKGLRGLGCEITEEHGLINCDGRSLTAADIHLDYPSVGATENIMMAAVSAEGETRIFNAAREPEIEDLERFLNKLGYFIRGAGTGTVTVRGKRRALSSADAEHTIIPDRIVAGTLMTAAAITGGEIALHRAERAHMGSVIDKLTEAGCRVYGEGGALRLKAPARPREVKLIETLPYPGFPTDMQSQFFALMSVAAGTSVIVENVFESRFKHGSELRRMGADFTQKDRTVVIRGVSRLTGAHVTAHDLRAGAALILAGLAAEGETVIENAELIDRGYERLELTLGALGANIARIG